MKNIEHKFKIGDKVKVNNDQTIYTIIDKFTLGINLMYKIKGNWEEKWRVGKVLTLVS